MDWEKGLCWMPYDCPWETAGKGLLFPPHGKSITSGVSLLLPTPSKALGPAWLRALLPNSQCKQYHTDCSPQCDIGTAGHHGLGMSFFTLPKVPLGSSTQVTAGEG